MIHRLLLIAVFGACLLLGVQAPNFTEQYAARVDAHWREASEALKGFQDVADRFHGGDLEALIRHHEKSPDSTFHAEAEPIRRLAQRRSRLAKERDAMDKGGFPRRAFHILLLGDREVAKETYAGYSPALRLDRQAVSAGLAAALFAAVLLELLLGAAKRVLGLANRD